MMKRILLFIIFSFSVCLANAQRKSCYQTLLDNGIEHFNKGNTNEAIRLWSGALDAEDGCPNMTSQQRQNLQDWIKKAQIKPFDHEPQMVSVQGGTFLMGSESGETDEKPTHYVTLSTFLTYPEKRRILLFSFLYQRFCA